LLAFREAGVQVSPATMSCPSLRASAPPCLPWAYKRTPEGGRGTFGFGFCFWVFRDFLIGFLLGFGFGFCLRGFGAGSFWKGKELLKRERIVEGTMIAKGKLLKRG
jgi:hypothetical protein